MNNFATGYSYQSSWSDFCNDRSEQLSTPLSPLPTCVPPATLLNVEKQFFSTLTLAKDGSTTFDDQPWDLYFWKAVPTGLLYTCGTLHSTSAPDLTTFNQQSYQRLLASGEIQHNKPDFSLLMTLTELYKGDQENFPAWSAKVWRDFNVNFGLRTSPHFDPSYLNRADDFTFSMSYEENFRGNFDRFYARNHALYADRLLWQQFPDGQMNELATFANVIRQDKRLQLYVPPLFTLPTDFSFIGFNANEKLWRFADNKINFALSARSALLFLAFELSSHDRLLSSSKDSRGNINFVSDENSYDSLCQDDFKLYDILLTMPITLLCFKPDLSRMQATFRGYESGLEEDHFSLWNRRYRDYFFCWLRSFTFTDSELARMWTFNSNMDCATLYRSINRELDTFSNMGPLYRKFHMPVGESYWVDDFSNKDFNESEFLQKNTFFVRLCQQLLAARL